MCLKLCNACCTTRKTVLCMWKIHTLMPRIHRTGSND
jgi:hypothetical protein